MTPLVSTEWLHKHLHDPNLRIVDCRWRMDDADAGRTAWLAGHIPGATYMSLDDDLAAPTGPGRHPLPAWETFAETLGSHGISNTSVVVVYDDTGTAFAGRLWWMLRAIGHTDVAVLDGGLPTWTGELEEGPTRVAPASFAPHPLDRASVDRSVVATAVGSTTLVDSRAPERYRGEVEPLDPVAGHIPTAINLPFSENLDANGRFLPADDLRTRFTSAGISDANDTVVYCGSGVTACHNLLAMKIAGLGMGTLYPGSWSDWSASGGEIATGA
jgi:thiosulfate/3-mercaptopyruvate sulfurtransferase